MSLAGRAAAFGDGLEDGAGGGRCGGPEPITLASATPATTAVSAAPATITRRARRALATCRPGGGSNVRPRVCAGPTGTPCPPGTPWPPGAGQTVAVVAACAAPTAPS